MNPKAKNTLIRIKNLIKQIVDLIDSFPKKTSAFKIAEQIIDSSTSIGANFTEAQSARTKKEFISTMGIVLKETKETLFWLEVINDLKLTSKENIDKIYKEYSELAKIFSSAIITSSKNLN